MSGLTYLFLTQWKNRLKALFRKPANWVATLFMVAMLGLVIWSGNQSTIKATSFRPITEAYALAMVLYVVMFAMTAYNGMNRGASLYSMADVNLLFAAPITPKRVLFFGLIQQLGTSLMVGFFLLFQYSWLRQAYGIGIDFLLWVLLGYGVSIFLGQLTAMTLYSSISGNGKRRLYAKTGLFGLCALEAAFVLIAAYLSPNGLLPGAVEAAAKWPAIIFPVGGWLGQMVRLLHQGNLAGLIYLGICVLYAAGLTAYLGRSQADYYEDVLAVTQRNYMTASAQKEGKFQEVVPDNVKIGRTGINHGFGASAFYYKHKLESRRAKRFVLDTMSIIFLIINLAFAFFMREYGLMPILIFSSYMLLFSVGTGRWARELLMPLVYLAPERPYTKLMWLLRQSLEGYLLEAALLFIPVGLMVGAGPIEIVAAVLCRWSFSLLYMAGNMVTERLFGGVSVKMFQLLLYIVVMLVLAAPGIVLAVLASVNGLSLISADFTWLMLLVIANTLISLLALFICRNILTYAELNQQ